VLSGDVVIEALAESDNTSGGHYAESESMAQGAVRYLQHAAPKAHAALTISRVEPPHLYQSLYSTPFVSKVTGISSPTTYKYPPDSGSPHGLIGNTWTTFAGPDKAQSTYYWVFTNSAEAASWDQDLTPISGATKVASLNAYGFVQPAQCGTFNVNSEFQSACFVRESNVVIESNVTDATQTPSSSPEYDDTAVLARMALMNLLHVATAPGN
jgi:hypothetical protein